MDTSGPSLLLRCRAVSSRELSKLALATQLMSTPSSESAGPCSEGMEADSPTVLSDNAKSGDLLDVRTRSNLMWADPEVEAFLFKPVSRDSVLRSRSLISDLMEPRPALSCGTLSSEPWTCQSS